MVSVAIADNQAAMPIDRGWFKDLARYVCDREAKKAVKLSLAFVDDAVIHGLNKRFLKHDYPTDVLTFPLGEGKTLEGEIVVSAQYAVEECGEYGWPAHMEASLYVVHGILHLCGYNDGAKADADRMSQRQELLLREFVAGRADRPYGATPHAGPPENSE